MSANFNPYVQGWRVGNGPSGNEQSSIFGALPAGSGNAIAARGGVGGDCVAVHTTYFHSNVLNMSVVDARCRQYCQIVMLRGKHTLPSRGT
jgi:diacylglycerol kinase family enzyme